MASLSEIYITKMNANEILKKHEDANEMHFHEVDRKWIIEAMEEYAALRQPPVIKSVCDCGKPIDRRYSPCCSLKCWSEKFE